ncbi:MAG: ribonuclease HII [Lentisphaeria bacterium]|nr:ribonuclease HII [Lentisphaeria bacterium]
MSVLQFPQNPDNLYEFEKLARSAGKLFVCGIDEAGRGPLAGPVVAAACILPAGLEIPYLNDSKKLTEKKRQQIYKFLIEHPDIRYSIQIGDARLIDEINILQATWRLMRQAALALEQTDFILVDGNAVPGFPCESQNVVKGDGKVACIAAASVLAKVHRDQLMLEYAEMFPDYGFGKHKGYGTSAHIQAIREYGPCEIHRKSFQPIKGMLEPDLFDLM